MVTTISAMKSGTLTSMPSPSKTIGLLFDDVDLGIDFDRIVGADLGAEAVLERGDDATAVGVVLGVCRREQHDVERQLDAIAADLHVAFFEHVQQADLDAFGQVRKFVDREQTTIRTGHHAVVQRELVAQVTTLGDLDRVDLADEVGNRGVGCGQLLGETTGCDAPS